MCKVKRWLCSKFLPEYCREELLAENAKLAKKITEQGQNIIALESYIEGLEYALRRQPRIIIKAGEAGK